MGPVGTMVPVDKKEKGVDVLHSGVGKLQPGQAFLLTIVARNLRGTFLAGKFEPSGNPKRNKRIWPAPEAQPNPVGSNPIF
eukprot:689887-Pelagomonas_calceolata.AAC.1